MAKMKTGTNVGLDRNYNNVCVGDTIRDKDGNTYRIDQYRMAITPDDGKGFKKIRLNDLKPFEVVPKPAPECKPIDPEDATLPPEATPEVDQQKLLHDALELLSDDDLLAEVDRRNLRPNIVEISDQDLAAELRARGYEVKATKTTIIEL